MDNTQATPQAAAPAQSPTPAVAQPALDPTKLTKVNDGASNSGDKKKGHVMIVEDEADAREIFVDLLQSAGYEVTSAVDGVDALAKLEVNKGTIDLVLLDIIMPNKDGVETLQEAVNNPDKYGKPKVVMLTNIGGDAAVEKAIELGALGYMLKSDTEPEQLLTNVNKYLTDTSFKAVPSKSGNALD